MPCKTINYFNFIIISFLFLIQEVYALDTVSMLYSDTGTVMGFETDEDSTYLIVPHSWTLENIDLDSQIYLKKVIENGVDYIDMRMTLVPDYSEFYTELLTIKQADPQAVFFPLSIEVVQANLALFELLGNVEASYEPSDGLNFNRAMYYRLRFTENQFEAFKQLANGGLALTGSVSYNYRTFNQEHSTTAPMVINIDSSELLFREEQFTSSEDWLKRSFTDYGLYLAKTLDGPYSLGSLNISITDSLMTGAFIPSMFDVADTGMSLIAYSIANNSNVSSNSNFTGNLKFHIPELNTTIDTNFDGIMKITLSKLTFELIVDFEITEARIDEKPNSFIKDFVNKIISENSEEFSQKVTEEFQSRIINETLFYISIDGF